MYEIIEKNLIVDHASIPYSIMIDMYSKMDNMLSFALYSFRVR